MPGNIALFIMLAIVVSPVLYVIGTWWMGRRAMARALRDACIICDSLNVKILNENMDYSCKQCGYDTTMARRPDMRDLVEQLRDVREARHAFSEASRLMKRAQTSATIGVFVHNQQNKYDYLAEAAERQMAGMTMLRDVSKRYPELLNMPVAGWQVSGPEGGFFFENIMADLRVKNEIKQSREEVDSYLEIVNALYSMLAKSVLDKCNTTEDGAGW